VPTWIVRATDSPGAREVLIPQPALERGDSEATAPATINTRHIVITKKRIFIEPSS
jgi:hypothetical protein